MKCYYPHYIILLFLLLGVTDACAQMDSCNVFLKGNYLEIGISPNGAFGTTINAPFTYITRPNASICRFPNTCDTAYPCTIRTACLGIVADPDKDGWTVGSPAYFGDYILRAGAIVDGWEVEFNGVTADAYMDIWSYCGPGYTGPGGFYLSGSNTKYTNSGGVLKGVWSGEYDAFWGGHKMSIEQEVTLDTGKLFATVQVKLKNIDTGTLRDVYYMRALNASDDEAISGDFNTHNYMEQAPNPQNRIMVATWGAHYSKAYLALVTKDCRALVFSSTSNFDWGSTLFPQSIEAIYNRSLYPLPYMYDSSTGKKFVGMMFQLGDLASGDSADIKYAYVLKREEVDSAFVAMEPKWQYNGRVYNSYDTAFVCKNSVTTISIIDGDGYNWHWYADPPSTPLLPTTGITTSIPLDSLPVQIMAVGNRSVCFPDTVHMVLVPSRTSPPPAPQAIAYCQYDKAVPLTVKGTDLLWYTTASGGTGSTVAPTPNTSIAGTFYYWVTQTLKGCESPRAKITVVVHPGAIDSFTYHIDYSCKNEGDTVIFSNRSTGAIDHTIWDFGDGATDTVISPVHIYKKHGAYVVTLTTMNAYSCVYSYTDSINIEHAIASSFTLVPDSICQYHTISFTATSTGTSSLRYLWDFGDGTTDTAASVSDTYNLPGIFKVVLITSDIVPCYDTAGKTVYVDKMPIVSFTASDSVICQGKPILFYGNYTTDGNVGVLWNFGDGSTLRNIKDPHHSYESPGTFTVIFNAQYRICPDTSLFTTVRVEGIPVVNLGPDTAMCPNSNAILISDKINAGNTAAKWLWNNGSSDSYIYATQAGVYYTTVTINGCSNSDSVAVKNDCYIDIPNAFSPDGDGINDYFFPRSLLSKGLTAFKMEIYNRWGNLIFRTTNINGRGWDGNFNGEAQGQGVYIYMIDVSMKDGTSQHYQGNVTLLR